AKCEGILCAIETAHAFAGACDWGRAQVAAGRRAEDLVVIVNTSGRGDKDVDTAARWFGLVTGEEIAESELVKAHEGEQP
ncbi:MAG: tryptophan synthase subunit beta, partial [Actinomycetota bacterium]|nr:tryptophan synthase subunit beta [Actinomycetota bacterium]